MNANSRIDRPTDIAPFDFLRSGVVVTGGAVLLTGACDWFGTSLHPIWPLQWLIPIFPLVCAARYGWRSGFLVSFLGLLIGNLNQLTYLRDLIRLPTPILILAIAGPGLLLALAVGVWRRLVNRGLLVAGPVMFALVFVGIEWTFFLPTDGATQGLTAYAQVPFIPFLQVASLGGVPAMEFLLLFLPASLAVLAVPSADLGRRRIAAWIGVGITAAVVVLANLPMLFPYRGAVVKVAAAAADDPQDPIGAYLACRNELMKQGAKLIVFPEKIATVDPTQLAAWDKALGAPEAPTVVGLHVTRPRKLNLARVYEVSRIDTYVKQHLVPGLELGYEPGHEMLSEPLGQTAFGVEICRDMGYPSLSRQYPASDAMLAVPAWDFDVDGRWAEQIAMVRGVEIGASVVRAGRDGMVSITDSSGRVLCETPSGSTTPAIAIADVPTTSRWTFYKAFGHVPFLILAALLAVLDAALTLGPKLRKHA